MSTNRSQNPAPGPRAGDEYDPPSINEISIDALIGTRHRSASITTEVPIATLADLPENRLLALRWKVCRDESYDRFEHDAIAASRFPCRIDWTPRVEVVPPVDPKRRRIWDALVDVLGPSCGGCGTSPGTRIDHDHATGLVRGLLCHHCNTWIEACTHASGCRWASYLNDPPAAHLGLTYTGQHLSKYRAKAKLVGWDPYGHLADVECPDTWKPRREAADRLPPLGERRAVDLPHRHPVPQRRHIPVGRKHRKRLSERQADTRSGVTGADEVRLGRGERTPNTPRTQRFAGHHGHDPVH